MLLYAWLQSNPKHVEKFCDLYANLGFDVLVVRVKFWQVLHPVKGSQLLAKDTLKFLTSNDIYESILLHGFSIGGYLWGECLVQIHEDAAKYESLINRIKGQIWDSMTGSKEIPVGQSKALFPNNLFLQSMARQLSGFCLKTFYNFATKHYHRSENHFHQKAIKVPALLIFSKTDPIGTELKSLTIADDFEALNIKVTRKCFDDSPHVSHFLKHRSEYTKAIVQHLELCNLRANYKSKL